MKRNSKQALIFKVNKIQTKKQELGKKWPKNLKRKKN